MIDSRLNPKMTGSAQCNKIARLVGGFRKQKTLARRNVVNVKRAGRFWFSAAKLAEFVSVKNSKSHTGPMCSKFEGSAPSIVWMVLSDVPLLGAFVRTKTSPAPYLRRECSEVATALMTRKDFICLKSFGATFHGTVLDLTIPRSEHCPTDSAWYRLASVFIAPFCLARLATKLIYCFLFHHMVGALKINTAVVACKCWPILHGLRMARFRAKNRSSSIGLKFLLAMETCLEH